MFEIYPKMSLYFMHAKNDISIIDFLLKNSKVFRVKRNVARFARYIVKNETFECDFQKLWHTTFWKKSVFFI